LAFNVFVFVQFVPVTVSVPPLFHFSNRLVETLKPQATL
jgi:hypothetical protein